MWILGQKKLTVLSIRCTLEVRKCTRIWRAFIVEINKEETRKKYLELFLNQGMNFENEILLRGEGCEDPKFFLLLFYFTGLFNYLIIRFLRLKISFILISFAINNISFYVLKSFVSKFNFSAASLVRNSEYTFFETMFSPRVQWSWRFEDLILN